MQRKESLPTAQILVFAEQILSGFCVSPGDAPGVEAEFIDFCEQPFKEAYFHRLLVARAAAKLAGQNPDALEVLLESARRYARVQEDIEDADPYAPNSIEILAGVPRCEKVITLLKEIIEQHPGMAQSDAAAALAALRG
jgi:hypothetical protein